MPEGIWGDRRARIGLVLLGCMVLVALLAPLVAPIDPSATRDVAGTRFLSPFTVDRHGTFHLLGTDKLGRDVWARLAWGTRISLGTGLLAVSLSLAIGVAIGALGGVGRGPLARALMAFTDFSLAVPRIVILLLLSTLWAPSAMLVVLVLGFTGWMPVARLVHGQVRSLRARPFVDGAVALGAPPGMVLRRHILPNALTPVIAAGTLGVGNAITLEAGLSFLGLGVQPPAPSWGSMIASGRDALVNAPWVAVFPGLALVLVVVACTLVGDALQERSAVGQ